MSQLIEFLADASAIGFVILGAVTAVTWLRRRDRSMAFLALAIVLLATVDGLGRVQTLIKVSNAALTLIDFIAFSGTAYALLLYRNSVIPLPRRWHVAAVASLVAASASLLSLQWLRSNRPLETAIVVVFFLVWCAIVCEPIVRFWLVARELPAVQAWRLRSLSLGFGQLVLVLVFAIVASLVSPTPITQVLADLGILAIIPFLYASFAPPSWLRRQWRAEEEEGIRSFMEQLLVDDDRDALANRALDWSMRLVGGSSAVLFASGGKTSTVHGLTESQVAQVRLQLDKLSSGLARITIDGAEHGAMSASIRGLTESRTLVVIAGPFTPAFGADETTRTTQLLSAFVTALDRRHLTAQLEESNKALQDANQHKSVFLANMSHELRTPLNAIIGFSELLTDAREGQFDDATRKRFLSQIMTSGKHLLSLINDILDLSKVEAGQMELRLQTVSIPETVDQVMLTVEPLVTKKGLTLTANVDGSGEILADGGKLRQMLLNLVSNAIKFTSEGGTVTIGALRLKDSVELSVADTGIGIADADQKQIFKEFHQVDTGPGRKHEGTGLGLALTRRFALLHGGEVRVTSRVNKGSVFTLTLPVRAAVLPAPEPAPPASAVAGNGHGPGPMVLVVEDDPAAAELLTRQLIGAGYRTEVARTGTQAVERARELKPAAITLDVILPEVDGWEVMTQLKSDARTSGIPILVVSVVDNPELGFALGAIDYFVKPIDAKVLIDRLNQFSLKEKAGKDGVRVLVVDDEPANRLWLAKALEPAGFTVLPAAGGREAIEMAKAEKPDFVLLDLMMPEVTGFDVVEALRADESTRETPILVLTAANLTDEDKRMLNGRVSQILKRGSVATSDIVGLLKRVVAHRNGKT